MYTNQVKRYYILTQYSDLVKYNYFYNLHILYAQ